ncbi:branched-chain amino acid transport system II carrier protein [Corynebacterium sp. 320]|uniref:branched-chain amino acid transport system II carrier protein n=1 Tax=Corynebacterium TaxID=1716 RepID=UPI00125CBCCB|nr:MULTISPECIES: branched-chain amino acid transport system II carrier protein [Corynebacterium]KAB1501407.1 branched-chain amino acid transport system II carrier protein [Corynebacterium sp. 320]KAB3525765.1 branched-chain amino acid transport system II carrier protein [Corynebacterium sp. 250]QNP92652.1 branched-chain amino acid transport system II carrier protein [Corynebacterium zhongnanshanii]
MSSSGTTSSTSSKKRTISTLFAVGLMLFSMFFGAGNLIFPPMLGIESGDHFVPAITGFLLTGVFMPVITVIAVAVSGSGVRDLASRAGAIFGVAFSVVAYLSIGPFYALPRAAAIGYELGIESTFGLSGGLWRLVCTAVFFSIAFAIVMFPGKVADTLGNYLTPVLLILLAVLTIVGIRSMNNPPIDATEEYSSNALVAGVLQGYFTMDSIAALAFAIIVVSSFGGSGITDHKKVVKLTSIAAITAGAFLLLVYIGLGVMGTRMPDKSSYSDGAAVLSSASKLTLGSTGDMVFSGVVLLACLTTAVGLIAACSAFFNELLPGISYRAWAITFTLIGFGISNLGLERILSMSAPVIGVIYPSAIALVLLSMFHLLVPRHRLPYSYRTAVYVALLFSLIDLGVNHNLLGMESLTFTSSIPLFTEGLGWLIPTVVATAIAFVVDMSRGRMRKESLISGEIDESLHSDVTSGSSTPNAAGKDD